MPNWHWKKKKPKTRLDNLKDSLEKSLLPIKRPVSLTRYDYNYAFNNGRFISELIQDAKVVMVRNRLTVIDYGQKKAWVIN